MFQIIWQKQYFFFGGMIKIVSDQWNFISTQPVIYMEKNPLYIWKILAKGYASLTNKSKGKFKVKIPWLSLVMTAQNFWNKEFKDSKRLLFVQ